MNTISFIWHRRALALMAVATTLTSASFAVPVSTLYLLARGLSYTQVFTLETVLVVSIMVCDLPTGRLADLTSDRAVLTCGYLVGAAASIGYATSTSYPGFIATNILGGLGIALASGADRSYLTSTLGEQEEGRLTGLLGHYGALGSLSGAAAGILGGLLAAHGVAWPAIAEAVTQVLGAVTILGLPSCPRTTAESPDTARVPLRAVARQVAATPVLWLSALQPWILVGAAFYLNQPRWQATGIGVRWFGLLLAVAQMAAAAGSHFSERLSRRCASPTRFIAVTTLATAGGFALMTVPHWAAAVAGFVAVLATASLRDPVSGALTTLAAPARTRATTLSMVSTCGSLIGAALNPLVGFLSHYSVEAACWAIAGALALFAVAWELIQHPTPDHGPRHCSSALGSGAPPL